jgi:alpha-L-fucosidase
MIGNFCRNEYGKLIFLQIRYNPGVLIPHKWENAMTIDKRAWTYRREATIEDFMSPEEVIAEIIVTVSCGGKYNIIKFKF